MADYDELIGLLQHLLTNKFAPKPDYVRGLLGDGRGNVEVPGRPDRNYVRFNRSATEYFEILNRAVNPVNNWPVLIGELPWQPGLTQVVDTDWSAYEQSGWGTNIASTSPHAPTHERPDGSPGSDPVDVYFRSIVPLRTYTLGSGSSTVYVNSYEYEYNSTGTVWPGLPGVDMTPIMGATATGTMRFAGVYLDPPTNVLGVVTGTTTVHTSAFDPPRVDFPANTIPSGRVRIYGGQSGILEADIQDARRPFAQAGTFANLVSITDIGGYFTGSTVESALQELGPGGAVAVHDHSTGSDGGQNLRAIDELEFDDAAALTIDGSGAITRTQVYHSVDTNGAAALDNLDTINGGVEGDVLILKATDDTRQIVVRHDQDNIWISKEADIILGASEDHLMLIYSEELMWCDIGWTKNDTNRVNRITSAESPYAMLLVDHILFCDTDGGNIGVNLPAGIDGKTYRIVNCGSSANNVIIDPNGSETINGAASGTVADGESIWIHYQQTEDWW